MSDLSDAIHAAMFAKLTASVTLGAVYVVVPDETQPPVVVIGDTQSEQVGGKNSDAERHDVPVRYIVSGTSKRALHLLMEEGKAALHNQPLTQAGFMLSPAVLTNSDDLRDIDEGALVGQQNYTVFVQRT